MMKKNTKLKTKAKKMAKKPVARKKKVAAKTAQKRKSTTKAKKQPRAKTASKSAKKLSIAELFELKKKKEALNHQSPQGVQQIPPHELHDKANLQEKATPTKIRSGASGTRHH